MDGALSSLLSLGCFMAPSVVLFPGRLSSHVTLTADKRRVYNG